MSAWSIEITSHMDGEELPGLTTLDSSMLNSKMEFSMDILGRSTKMVSLIIMNFKMASCSEIFDF